MQRAARGPDPGTDEKAGAEGPLQWNNRLNHYLLEKTPLARGSRALGPATTT